MAGRKGFGSKFEYDSTGAGAWVELAEITRIRPWTKKAEVLDGSSMSSAARTREKFAGMIEEGDFSADLNWDESLASHAFMKANVGAETLIHFRVSSPPKGAVAAKVATFDGFFQQVSPEQPFDGKMTCAVTVCISGVVSVYA